jgi:hypothetical protein
MRGKEGNHLTSMDFNLGGTIVPTRNAASLKRDVSGFGESCCLRQHSSL